MKQAAKAQMGQTAKSLDGPDGALSWVKAFDVEGTSRR